MGRSIRVTCSTVRRGRTPYQPWHLHRFLRAAYVDGRDGRRRGLTATGQLAVGFEKGCVVSLPDLVPAGPRAGSPHGGAGHRAKPAVFPPRLPRPPRNGAPVVGTDGTIYLVKNGQRHAIVPAALTDDDLAAIPQGDAYADGRIPTDGGSSLFATDRARHERRPDSSIHAGAYPDAGANRHAAAHRRDAAVDRQR